MRRGTSSGWGIVEHRGFEGLRRLEADWHRLVEQMPERGFQHAFETHLAYFTHVPSRHGPFTCLALTDGSQVRAICPLEPDVVTILGRATRVWALPVGRRNIPRDVVCPPGEARRELLPAVVRFLSQSADRPRWLVLDRIPDGSAALRCLETLDPGRYCTDVVGTADVSDCRGPFAELTARWSGKFRGNLRAARHDLAALPDVRFECASDPPALEREFAAFLEVEASGWKGREGGALRQNPEPLALCRELVTRLGAAGRCEIHALYAGGRCIASQICLRGGAEMATLKTAYDERYARVTPGLLLRERILERCCADPAVDRLNMLSSAEWHRSWRPAVVPLYCAYVGLGRWSGPALVSLLRLRLRYGPRVKGWLLRSRGGARLLSRLRGG